MRVEASRRFLLHLLLAAFGALAASAVAEAAVPAEFHFDPISIRYTFAPDWTAQPRRIRVAVEFYSRNASRTVLRLPSAWARAGALYDGIRNLRAVTPGAEIVENGDPAERILKYPPLTPIRLEYDLVQKRRGALDGDTFFEPILDSAYFHFFGYGAFVLPVEFEDKRFTADIFWKDVPTAWSLASSHGGGGPGAAHWHLADASATTLRHAVYVGGDFRVAETRIEGRPLYVALRGAWPFSDAAFAAEIRRVVAAQRAFWNDDAFPYFLVTLVPGDAARGDTSGTAVTNAFSVEVPRDFDIPSSQFDFLVGHEHLHTWIPARFGRLLKEDPSSYWFSEGFTNFFAHRLLVRSGLWSIERYAEEIDRMIGAALSMPERGADNARVAREFWSSRGIGELPYLRGEFLALRWDAQLRRKGNGESMDEAMRALAARDNSARPATDNVRAKLAALLGGSVEADYAKYILGGAEPGIDAALLGPCFSYSTEPVREFHLGFDAAKLRDNEIASVEPDSNAYAAGLRDGQRVKGYSVYMGDIERKAQVTIAQRAPPGQKIADRVVEFAPVRDSAHAWPRFRARPEAAQDPACRAWFGL